MTGLLSLLEDLRAQGDSREQEDLRQQQYRHLRRGDAQTTVREDELPGDRRLLIVVGDFNFDSSSSGFRRLVSEAGLVSAAANCSSVAATAADRCSNCYHVPKYSGVHEVVAVRAIRCIRAPSVPVLMGGQLLPYC